MKRHPFLLGFLVIGIVLAVFWGLALLTYSLVSDQRANRLIPGSKSVGVVEIEGVIADSKDLLDQLIDDRDDDSVKAIVLRIDSPGGAVGPSQEIYREVLRIREKKPVIVSMGGVAASGGYYIACAGTKVFANEGTLTGSIGVIMDFVNVQGLLEWMRLRSRVIKSGKFKDIGSPTRDMTREEADLLQNLVDDVKEQFVEAIVKGRGEANPALVTATRVRALADGRIFSGRQAKDLGLVDELGNFRDAVSAAATMGGITGEPNLVYPRKKRTTFFDMFFKEMFQSMRQAARQAAQAGSQEPGLRY